MSRSPEFVALCEDAKSRIQEVEIDAVEQAMKAGEGTLIIDVREKEEFDKEHLPNATHLSKGLIEVKIHQLAKDKDTKMVLYCGGGNRSALAADNLQKMGYTNVLSMIGGFRGWKSAGKSTE